MKIFLKTISLKKTTCSKVINYALSKCYFGQAIIKEAHEGDLGKHFGQDKTLIIIREYFSKPKMGKHVEQLI